MQHCERARVLKEQAFSIKMWKNGFEVILRNKEDHQLMPKKNPEIPWENYWRSTACRKQLGFTNKGRSQNAPPRGWGFRWALCLGSECSTGHHDQIWKTGRSEERKCRGHWWWGGKGSHFAWSSGSETDVRHVGCSPMSWWRQWNHISQISAAACICDKG